MVRPAAGLSWRSDAAPYSAAVVFAASLRFLQEVWVEDGAASEMHVGDLCWRVFQRSPPDIGSVDLWSDDSGRAQVLTVSGGRVCDFVVRPGRAGLHQASRALDWLEQNGRQQGSTSLRVGRRVNSAPVRALLESRGFALLATGYPAMSRSIIADTAASPSVPPGYEVRPLGDDELAPRVAAFRAAFADDELSVEAYRALRGCSPYRPQLDIVVVAADGTIAAFATFWLDPENGVVQVEPAGCHPEHRRRGLTRAAILHGLVIASQLGATEALVRASSENPAARALYESCGFRIASARFGFAKDLTVPVGAP